MTAKTGDPYPRQIIYWEKVCKNTLKRRGEESLQDLKLEKKTKEKISREAEIPSEGFGDVEKSLLHILALSSGPCLYP